MMINETFIKRAITRLAPVVSLLRDLHINKFYFGGSGLTKTFADLDIFPFTKPPETFPTVLDWTVEVVTKNATTYTHLKHPTVQICKYYKPSLHDLVNSFDFAHIQIGVEMDVTASPIKVERVYFSPAFISYHTIQDSNFIGSDYPLASLTRLLKYYKRGQISKGKAVAAIIKIVEAVVDRGFNDYEDFKDQLDSVDLGLVPEELDKLEFEELQKLFELLRRDK